MKQAQIMRIRKLLQFVCKSQGFEQQELSLSKSKPSLEPPPPPIDKGYVRKLIQMIAFSQVAPLEIPHQICVKIQELQDLQDLYEKQEYEKIKSSLKSGNSKRKSLPHKPLSENELQLLSTFKHL